MKNSILFLITLLICSDLLSAKPLEFVENRGQIATVDGKPCPEMLYTIYNSTTSVYLRKSGLSFIFSKPNKLPENLKNKSKIDDNLNSESSYSLYRMDMEFLNTNPDVLILGLRNGMDYYNYYLPQCHDGITNVTIYRKIVYENIYPNIDLVIYENDKNELEYDFEVNPGGEPDNIRIKFTGAESIDINNDGTLITKNPLGSLEHFQPTSFQENNFRGIKEKVHCSFDMELNSIIKFNIGNYDKSRQLIIDPITRLWATYYGGKNSDYTKGIASDNDFVYVCGNTSSDNVNNVIATPGALVTTYPGLTSAYIVKFTKDGKRVWSTYYGSATNSLAIDIDKKKNIYFTGTTSDSISISTPGSQQSIFGDTTDTFLVKLDAGGKRIWGTYFGGKSFEDGRKLAIDNLNNIYIVGETSSDNTNNCIATPNAHQKVHSGYSQDAFLAKYNSDGKRIWSTYYGGTGGEIATGVAVDSSSNVFIVGSTSTDNDDKQNIIATAGAFQTNINPVLYNTDGFIACFDSSGKRQWGTYYGDKLLDELEDICYDKKGYLYVTGYTYSVFQNNMLTTPGAFDVYHNTKNRATIIAKFDIHGKRIWGTLFGNDCSDCTNNGVAVSIDKFGKIYIAGNTYENQGKLSTPGSFQEKYGGGTGDAYLAMFDGAGKRLYCTYYGGKGFEDAEDLSIGTDGIINMCGHTEGPNPVGVISTANSHQPVFGGLSNLDDDGWIVRFFQDDFTSNSLNVWLPDSNVYVGQYLCIPFMTDFNNNSSATYKIIYNTEVQFDAGCFYPDTLLNTKQTGIGINTGNRYIDFTGNNLPLSGNDTNICWICGTVLLCDMDTIPLIISKFDLSKPDIYISKRDGSLRIGGVCAKNLRSVRYLGKSSLAILPNPVSSSSLIKFSIPDESDISIKIYNVYGQEVSSLLNRHQKAGDYIIPFAPDKFNITPGIYFIRMTAGSENLVGKFVYPE